MTIIVDRSDLNFLIMVVTSIPELVVSGKARIEGNSAVFAQLQSMLVKFDGRFAIMPGTK